MKFKKNDIFICDGQEVKILNLLGEGGQGEVYLVDKGGDLLALKIYKDETSDDFRNNLKRNTEIGIRHFCGPKQS